MAVDWNQVEAMGDPQEQRKILSETRHKFQTLVNQEVWDELCEAAKGQAENLRQEAEGILPSMDGIIQKEALYQRAKGIEHFMLVPEIVIEDLTDSINKLTAIIEGEDNVDQ